MPFIAFLRLELESYRSRAGESLIAASLYVIGALLFGLAQPAGSLGLPPSIAALWLAMFLILSVVQFSLFERDGRSGFLEQWPLLPLSLEWLVFGKALGHWIAFALPMLIVAPAAALLLNLPASALPALLTCLMAASLCLVFLGTLAAAASLRLRSGETVAILLVLPLAAPVMIFGAAASSGSERSSLYFLIALTLILPPACAFVSARLLRYTA